MNTPRYTVKPVTTPFGEMFALVDHLRGEVGPARYLFKEQAEQAAARCNLRHAQQQGDQHG